MLHFRTPCGSCWCWCWTPSTHALLDRTHNSHHARPLTHVHPQDALRQLLVLDAIDADGAVTPLGLRMAGLPLDPALARALIAARELG